MEVAGLFRVLVGSDPESGPEPHAILLYPVGPRWTMGVREEKKLHTTARFGGSLHRSLVLSLKAG